MIRNQKVQLAQGRVHRMKIRESHTDEIEAGSPIRDHQNPFQLLNDEYLSSDTDSENGEAKTTRLALHVDIEEDSERTDAFVEMQTEQKPQSATAAKSPPPKPAKSLTPQNQRPPKQITILKPPPRALTPSSASEQSSQRTLHIPPPKITPLNAFRERVLTYLDIIINADEPLQASDEFKKEIKEQFIPKVISTIFAAEINRRFQKLFSLNDPGKSKAVFNSIIDSGLFQKLFPYITDTEELKADLLSHYHTIYLDDPSMSSLLKRFYDKLLLITANCNHADVIKKTPILNEFYSIFEGYELNRNNNSDKLNEWLGSVLFMNRQSSANFMRLLEEDYLEKFFPAQARDLIANQAELLKIFKQIDERSWSYRNYWSSNPKKGFTVGTDHIVYAHFIVCAMASTTNNTKKSLIAMIENNDIFRRTFIDYKDPSAYYNLFRQAFENIHGVKVINPFTVLSSSDKATKFTYGLPSASLFSSTPRQGRQAVSKQDSRVTHNGTASFTP